MCDATETREAAGAAGADDVMAAKYFVYGAGRWRALDVGSGRVAGWRRRARFVFVRRGRLQLARRAIVLRALRALAAGAPGAAADGARLPTRSKERHKPAAPPAPPAAAPAPPAAPPAPPCMHHCCAHCHSAVSCVAGTAPRAALPAVPAPAAAAPSPTPDKPSPCKAAGVARSPGKQRPQYRELVISEQEVALVREYLRGSRGGELARYDAEPRYRRAVLYSLHPVVRLRPLPAALLAQYDQTRQGPRPESPDTDDKENAAHAAPSAEAARRAPPAGPAPQPHLVERTNAGKRPRLAERTNRAASPGGLAHVISKRAGPGKEYSSLEDHAIVAWLSSGSRASQVKGNAVWRSLQAVYPALAGRARSWHSLRNRYLRYILPALPALRLQPALQQRLRAAAATGSIKSKSAARRNSLLHQTPVRSASSRVARRGAASPPPSPSPSPAPVSRSPSSASSPATDHARTPSPPARRSLRPRDAGSSGSKPRSPRKAPSPRAAPPTRYSEVTRQFAARHRPPTLESETASSSGPASAGQSSSDTRSPTPASRSVPPRAARTRRLYNPT